MEMYILVDVIKFQFFDIASLSIVLLVYLCFWYWYMLHKKIKNKILISMKKKNNSFKSRYLIINYFFKRLCGRVS